ncbi:ParB/RepB/Spo0J family partition protein [Desulfovibrio desulfuricans]|uniref:ParB/RepB/Spo0J family partition protein n=1 Tax=Desulfovibrio desulfuricans TaxID=876 RepID=UPI0003B3312C|nr:ParB/RepB/Spo0J family partition protein [Desulfovibrio desulfuricans]MDD3682257.1 ParB/RepB/Spo0J family partition protein [Desulfovibrio desulfuricans]QTO40326.1 ParB/RepB/Spo0J family partition protein [Desulfovibrio desulfuricans]
MSSSKGLGRGLDALFGGTAPKQEPQGQESSVNLMPITALHPNPNQPRRHFDDAALRELADSIKSQGIIQPLLVRPLGGENTYQIVAGERRWRAAQLAGLKEVPVYVRQLSDKEVMAAALIENLQREDLNPIEEAEALQALRDALELTQEELASRLGKSRPAIANALRLLQLSATARADIQAGLLSAGHARCLLGIDAPIASEALRQRILSHKLTVREAEDAAAFWRGHNALPWEQEDTTPQPRAKAPRKKSPQFKTLQMNLCSSIGCKTQVSGDENSGRIAFAYGSREELEQLLQKLGVALPEAEEESTENPAK